MRSVLTDTKPITDAASSAASTIREALDHVPMPSHLPDTGDLPHLADLGDSVVGLVDSVGDVAGKTVGVVSGATTAAMTRLGIIRRSNRRRSLIIGGIVVIGVATAAVVIARRSQSTGADARESDARSNASNVGTTDSDAPKTPRENPRVAAVS